MKIPRPSQRIINSKFKIFTLNETNVKAGEHFFTEESLDVLHTGSFSFSYTNEETLKHNYQEALKQEIMATQSKVDTWLNKEPTKCLHEHVYYCSEACYPDSTMALEYNSNINPHIIHETKRGVLISKIDFVL